MKLHYRKLGEGQPLIILHGLFGSSDNWQSLAKKISEDFEVYLVDQRNHGHSPHSEEFDYQLMTDDLLELIEDLSLENVLLLGHSMGGKTAMTFAQQYPEYLSKLLVIDIGPKQYPLHHQQILSGLASIDLEVINSRGLADQQLSKFIDEPSTKQFLLKNLYWVEKGKLGWRINIPVLTREIHQIVEGLGRIKVEIPTLFVRGKLSNYILDEDLDKIKSQFINSNVVGIENAGHWVHAESPAEFYNVVMDFCKEN